MGIEVDQPDALTLAHMACDRADPDGAVSAQYERDLAARDRRRHAARRVLDDLDDRLDVLRAGLLAIGRQRHTGRSPSSRTTSPADRMAPSRPASRNALGACS